MLKHKKQISVHKYRRIAKQYKGHPVKVYAVVDNSNIVKTMMSAYIFEQHVYCMDRLGTKDFHLGYFRIPISQVYVIRDVDYRLH